MWCDMGHCEMYNPVSSVSYPDDVGVLAWGVGRRQSGYWFLGTGHFPAAPNCTFLVAVAALEKL